jgi:hypothetical protein
LFVKLF